jgi:hypothetical protein
MGIVSNVGDVAKKAWDLTGSKAIGAFNKMGKWGKIGVGAVAAAGTLYAGSRMLSGSRSEPSHALPDYEPMPQMMPQQGQQQMMMAQPVMMGRGDTSMSDSSEHPALKNFSPALETVKTGAWGAIKGAIIGAAIVGVAAVALPALIGGVIGGVAGGGILSIITAPLGAVVGGGISAGLGGAIAGGMFGAKWGALIGGGMSMLGAGEKIEEKKQQMVENYERNEMRQERKMAMNMRYASMQQPARTMGVSPNALPNQQVGMGHQIA